MPTALPQQNPPPGGGRSGGGCFIVNGQEVCGLCLALHTMIDTPSGSVAVEDLTPGREVWTVNASGNRISAAVEKVSRTPVQPGHQMAHILLIDGRELLVYPGHPTADGRTVGELKAGDKLNGAIIKEVEFVTYNSNYTYDLLPAGETGDYFANGILMGSTLANHHR